MVRYFRRIGKRAWREIAPSQYTAERQAALSAKLPSRIQFAEVDTRTHVEIVGDPRTVIGAVYVMHEERKLWTTCFVVNELSYGQAIHRAHEWCEKRGYVVADVRLLG